MTTSAIEPKKNFMIFSFIDTYSAVCLIDRLIYCYNYQLIALNVPQNDNFSYNRQ